MKTILELIKEENITTIHEFLEKHPDRWIQGKMYDNSHLHKFRGEERDACLVGLASLIYPDLEGTVNFFNKIIEVLPENFCIVSEFNDDKHTTVQDVIALTKKAGV